MTYLMELPVEDGGYLRVQASVSDIDGSLELAAMQPGQIVVKARNSVEHALDEIKPAISSVIGKLRSMSPDEMSVEFGLALTAEAGAVITRGSAEVHFLVSMSWKSPDPEAGRCADERSSAADAKA